MERKLAAIAAADVEGFSRLVGLDEAGILVRLKEIRRLAIEPQLARHGGRIVKTMGDGLLLDFASAVNAVACAVESQRHVAEVEMEVGAERRIAFRFGIHLGDIVIDGDDILGDGVNIAARLQALATPGGLCISGAVMDEVRARLPHRFIDEGDQTLKNIARPVRMFRLLEQYADAVLSPASAAFTARPAVAVLPFDHMSGDPAEDYFVDGLTEEIIATLSYWRWFPVIARNSTFVYKGKPKNAAQIGKELGVAYLVEGSARRGGSRVAHYRSAHRCCEWPSTLGGALTEKSLIFSPCKKRLPSALSSASNPRSTELKSNGALRTRPKHLGAWDFALKALSLQERMSRSRHAKRSTTRSRSIPRWVSPGRC